MIGEIRSWFDRPKDQLHVEAIYKNQMLTAAMDSKIVDDIRKAVVDRYIQENYDELVKQIDFTELRNKISEGVASEMVSRLMAKVTGDEA